MTTDVHTSKMSSGPPGILSSSSQLIAAAQDRAKRGYSPAGPSLPETLRASKPNTKTCVEEPIHWTPDNAACRVYQDRKKLLTTRWLYISRDRKKGLETWEGCKQPVHTQCYGDGRARSSYTSMTGVFTSNHI